MCGLKLVFPHCFFAAAARTYWIGLTDLDREGRFIWAGTHRVASFVKWGSGQPNSDGNCVGMDSNGLWWDGSCRSTYPVICEKNLA